MLPIKGYTDTDSIQIHQRNLKGINLAYYYNMTSDTTLLLNKLFNDPKTGFTGADKFLKQVKVFLSLNPIHQVFQKPTLQKTK